MEREVKPRTAEAAPPPGAAGGQARARGLAPAATGRAAARAAKRNRPMAAGGGTAGRGCR
eukprot:CAMPEP_0175359480 /NCGR_PEP_ID=MMETSP0095-20121207/15539_1 /TAXON_ID=311494 /ORGANISM="Alexandrium monilatum, Strain CCMP3105" /LENGTH=59 /DNA_ID=CAMNT_0016657249 /DNA_START=87 /DNA_END=263 /DNA_ORIENTATION=+